MRKILITGGTVFVSRYVAQYYVEHGEEVYVLNRNTKVQVEGVHVIVGDRHELRDKLKSYEFDVVLDITAYTRDDVKELMDALGTYQDYIFLSSSAVYPETLTQPFREEQQVGPNVFWREYGVHKYEAEQYLLERNPGAYILRPPYLYGPMNNVYREQFVFDCALHGLPFYMPKDGSMNLQFFYIRDLCKLMDAILLNHPKEHIMNVGNESMVTIKEWVKACYQVCGKVPQLIEVQDSCNQREYFSFYDYDYRLEVAKQKEILPDTTPLLTGLHASLEWYQNHEEEVRKRPYLEYIEKNFN